MPHSYFIDAETISKYSSLIEEVDEFCEINAFVSDHRFIYEVSGITMCDGDEVIIAVAEVLNMDATWICYWNPICGEHTAEYLHRELRENKVEKVILFSRNNFDEMMNYFGSMMALSDSEDEDDQLLLSVAKLLCEGNLFKSIIKTVSSIYYLPPKTTNADQS